METGKTWKDVESFFPKVASESHDCLNGLSLKVEIEAVVREGTKITMKEPEGDLALKEFLTVDFAKAIMSKNVGVNLQKNGIYRQHLLDPNLLEGLENLPDIQLVNGMIIDSMSFYKKENLPMMNCREIFKILGAKIDNLSNLQLTTKLNKLFSEHQGLKKSINHRNGQDKLNVFLFAATDFTGTNKTATSPSSYSNAWHKEDNIKLATAEKQLSSLRRQIEDLEGELLQEKHKNSVVQDSLQKCKQEMKGLQQQLADDIDSFDRLKCHSQNVTIKLQDAQNTIKKIKAANFYKRLKAKEKRLRKKENTIEQHVNGECEKKICMEQKRSSALRKQLAHLRKSTDREIAQSEEAVNFLQQQPEPNLLNIEFMGQDAILHLKDEKGRFKQEAILCVIQMIGENEVPAARCGEVIQTVVKHLINVHVPDTDLPSLRSAIRFADRGHVISKLHVTETLLEADHYDLHSDGTSKCGKKYLSQQMTTLTVSMCTGFTPVCTEDTATLLDTTLDLLRELSDLYSTDEAEEIFQKLLKNLSALMTDRAAVNKSFGRALAAEKQHILQTEDEIQLLYCNAHYLLGLSAACEKVCTYF